MAAWQLWAALAVLLAGCGYHALLYPTQVMCGSGGIAVQLYWTVWVRVDWADVRRVGPGKPLTPKWAPRLHWDSDGFYTVTVGRLVPPFIGLSARAIRDQPGLLRHLADSLGGRFSWEH